jgi:cell wall-associated NlpC family hydrolase
MSPPPAASGLAPPPAIGRFIGIPYVNRGDGFDGCDCWGLVWLFHREALGHEVPRYAGYSDAEGEDIPARIREGWEGWAHVLPGQEELGDVLALRVGQHPVHVGVVVSRGQMLHVLRGANSSLARYDVGLWQHALMRIGRWKS